MRTITYTYIHNRVDLEQINGKYTYAYSIKNRWIRLIEITLLLYDQVCVYITLTISVTIWAKRRKRKWLCSRLWLIKVGYMTRLGFYNLYSLNVRVFMATFFLLELCHECEDLTYNSLSSSKILIDCYVFFEIWCC